MPKVSTPTLFTAGLSVLLGSSGGAAVALLLTPIVTRSYSPAAYGMFAGVVAIVSSLTGVSTLRLEVLALRAPTKAASDRLLSDSLLVSVLVGSLASVVSIVAVVFSGASAWWLAVGPLVCVASLQLVSTAANVRQRRYGLVGLGNFVQQAGTPAVQIVAAFPGIGMSGLLLGFLLPRLYWVRSICGLPAAWLRSLNDVGIRRFAATSGSSALLNSTASQLPILVVTTAYGAASAGLVAVGIRAFVAPLGLVGQAMSSASNGEVSERIRQGDYDGARRIVRLGAGVLAGVGFIPAAVVVALAPSHMASFLGESWGSAGQVVQALMPGAYAQLCTSPFAQTLNISNRSGWLLCWDVARFVLIALGLGVPSLLGADLVATIWVYSAAMVFTYVLLGYLVNAALSQPNQKEIPLL